MQQDATKPFLVLALSFGEFGGLPPSYDWIFCILVVYCEVVINRLTNYIHLPLDAFADIRPFAYPIQVLGLGFSS